MKQRHVQLDYVSRVPSPGGLEIFARWIKQAAFAVFVFAALLVAQDLISSPTRVQIFHYPDRGMYDVNPWSRVTIDENRDGVHFKMLGVEYYNRWPSYMTAKRILIDHRTLLAAAAVMLALAAVCERVVGNRRRRPISDSNDTL